MSRQETFVLPSRHGHSLHGVVHFPESSGRRPAVVICHGFKGFMDWGFFPPLAELLAERGLVAVRFNFSGSGMRPGDELVSDPAAFRGATFGKDLDELLDVLGAVGHKIAAERADPERLGLLGHSRGGATAVLAAAHPEWRQRLGALVTWAAVASYADRYDEATRRDWRERGFQPVQNARTGQQLEIGACVLDELEARGDELEPIHAAPAVRAPWLIAHGEADEAVPVSDARRLDAGSTAMHELLLVPGGGHTFGAKHPFAGPTAELTRAMNATQTWLRRHLG